MGNNRRTTLGRELIEALKSVHDDLNGIKMLPERIPELDKLCEQTKISGIDKWSNEQYVNFVKQVRKRNQK